MLVGRDGDGGHETCDGASVYCILPRPQSGCCCAGASLMTLTEAAHVAQIDITAGGGAAAARDHHTGWDNPATVHTSVPQFWHRCT